MPTSAQTRRSNNSINLTMPSSPCCGASSRALLPTMLLPKNAKPILPSTLSIAMLPVAVPVSDCSIGGGDWPKRAREAAERLTRLWPTALGWRAITGGVQSHLRHRPPGNHLRERRCRAAQRSDLDLGRVQIRRSDHPAAGRAFARCVRYRSRRRSPDQAVQ